MSVEYYFPGVTLLITHYNRSSSLERLLSVFYNLNCRFDDIVVSDDASKPEHQEKLQALQQVYHFRLITSPTPGNKGFPNNINKGQDAVKTPYTLYVQEDFVPSAICPQHLLDGLQFMNEDKSLDYVRFWSFYRYPTLKPYGKGFSETIYNPWTFNHLTFFMYSDNPHLRRNNFLQKFGRYQEDIDGNISEHNKSISYIQNKGRGLFYEQYETLFEHANSLDEPSTFSRANWRQSKNPAFLLARWGYLRFKWLRSLWEVKTMPKQI
jgi:glycosyltransferase involved in cell wall biosynthesis